MQILFVTIQANKFITDNIFIKKLRKLITYYKNYFIIEAAIFLNELLDVND